MGVFSRIPREVLKTVRDPRRVLALRDRRKRAALRQSLGAPGSWREEGSFRVRDYPSYDDYVRHQSAKVALKGDLADYDLRFRTALRERLSADPDVGPGASALCLAARIGSEVKAFHDVGCFAVGIDLNPADGDRYVLRGDFHELQFPDGSVDAVFSNSLDHSLDLGRVLAEVRRVLKPGGLLLLEAMRGSAEGKDAGAFESLHWGTVDDLSDAVREAGFRPAGRYPIEEPWLGHHLRFRSSRRARVPRPSS